MESDLQQHHHRFHLHEQHQRQINSGLTRYQSAPSSYFSSSLDRDSLEEFLNRPTSPETERIFNRFLRSSESDNNADSFLDQSFVEKKPAEIKTEHENPIPFPTNDETETTMNQKQSDFVSSSQNLYNQNKNQLQNNNPPLNRRSGSNLLRQSSSPAGFFFTRDIEQAFSAAMGNIGGDHNTINNKNNKEESSSGLMTPISETDNKPKFSSELPPRTLSGGLSRSSWEESNFISDIKPNLKTLKRGDWTLSSGLNQSETKNVDSAKRPPLAHHLSLPKSLSDIEKLLESSDSVPWKIRAKRGCATHPRSIAERVRRTKISERMKRLQDLVPNMDKQTNTADMLDLAVGYIKDLQKQVQILSENRATCSCSSMQPP